ncbi:MAG TPA: DUF2961 domain-containing protein [Bacteriovoracaceae bacterium]|nr:DUF2961 domain-containing protein [Bacteriovoracaceae bacterium]
MITVKELSLTTLALCLSVSICLNAVAAEKLNPVLADLLTFRPGIVTKLTSSHDPTGNNGDGNWHGHSTEVINGQEYKVLFHEKGEGRITRLWMTGSLGSDYPRDYKEIWFIIDGKTAYKGDVVDYFSGRGPFAYPLVLNRQASSGAYTSYVPFSYAHEAKILFKGTPEYFQVSYQEGTGASAGPGYEELLNFAKEAWWFNPNMVTIPGQIPAGQEFVVANGPVTISQLQLQVQETGLKDLWIQVGTQNPIPLGFYFGAAVTGHEQAMGWQTTRNALFYNDEFDKILATRLPIILQEGESLKIVNRSEVDQGVLIGHLESDVDYSQKGVSLISDYRSQMAPGTPTTYPVFEEKGNLKLFSVIHQLIDAIPGDRLFLEGDEMIRLDGLEYPQLLGTGTEDYYNGGWYFLGPHSNPFSGLPRFIVNNPEDGWSHANYELDLYRHHIPDPIIGRDGIRFGFEAGPYGDYLPLRSRSLAHGYKFNDYLPVAKRTIQEIQITRSGSKVTSQNVLSAFDSEKASKEIEKNVTYSQNGIIEIPVLCDGNPFLLVRTYDTAKAFQHAKVYLGGKYKGEFFDSVATVARRFAQDSMWIERESCLNPAGSTLRLEIQGDVAFSEIEYQIHYFQKNKQDKTLITFEPMKKIFDTGDKYYVNDHSIVQAADGSWHLFGIYHENPFGPDYEHEFVHALSTKSNPFDQESTFEYANPPIALRTSFDLGETHIWAPHVTKIGDEHVMFYHGGGKDNDVASIRKAVSHDLYKWEKSPAPMFEDICVARDPHLLKVGSIWALYYTRCDSVEKRISGVAYRTSTDLKTWSEPQMALVMTGTTPMFNSGFTESPFLFEKDGWYYLSVTSYPIEWDYTSLYRSRSPFNFSEAPIANFNSHAGEWFEVDGRMFLTHAGAGQNGVWAQEVKGL